MKELKPTYNVEFWEYIYARELKKYLALLEKKANFLKQLKTIDLFSIPEAKAIGINKQIHFIEVELKILYGMKLFMDEMKTCYLDSCCKIYDVYHSKNLMLEVENLKLKGQL